MGGLTSHDHKHRKAKWHFHWYTLRKPTAKRWILKIMLWIKGLSFQLWQFFGVHVTFLGGHLPPTHHLYFCWTDNDQSNPLKIWIPPMITLPVTNSKSPWKWMVGILLSYWDGLFSGANLLLVSGRVGIQLPSCFSWWDQLRKPTSMGCAGVGFHGSLSR